MAGTLNAEKEKHNNFNRTIMINSFFIVGNTPVTWYGTKVQEIHHLHQQKRQDFQN
jgi:hypothetical protein